MKKQIKSISNEEDVMTYDIKPKVKIILGVALMILLLGLPLAYADGFVTLYNDTFDNSDNWVFAGAGGGCVIAGGELNCGNNDYATFLPIIPNMSQTGLAWRMTFYDLSNSGSVGHFWFLLKTNNETVSGATNTLIMRESGGNIITASATDLLIGTSGASTPHNFTVTMYPNNTLDLVSDNVFVGSADTTSNGTFPIFWTDSAGGITIVKGFAVEQFQIDAPIPSVEETEIETHFTTLSSIAGGGLMTAGILIALSMGFIAQFRRRK